MKITAPPKSDQLNAIDFVGGKAKAYTITGVKQFNREQQPYEITLQGEDRVWRPCKTAVRILADIWGDEGDDWVGKRVGLYRDLEVKFSGDDVSGIRVSHMSDLPSGDREHTTNPIPISRGRNKKFVIKPLPPETPTYKPIPATFADRINAGGLSSEEQAKALAYLDKLTDADPALVDELRGKLDAMGAGDE